MKYQTLLATFCAILFSVVGCEKRFRDAKVGSFDVNSNTGIATGQAFGIEFKAEGASRVETKSQLGTSQEFSSQAEINLADDLKIKLQTKIKSESVAFELNGKSFGDLKAADKVEIAKDRSVMVNGEKRTTSESTPE